MSIFRNKFFQMATVYSDSRFTSSADVYTDHCNAGINAETLYNDILLVLDNNITVKVTDNATAAAIGGFYKGIASTGGNLELNANNVAKKITVTAKFSHDVVPLTSAYGVYGENVSIFGLEFLYTINATASHSGNAGAFGFRTDTLAAEAKLVKPITVSAATTEYGAFAEATAIYAADLLYLYNGIAGNITSKATAKKGYSAATGIVCYETMTIAKQLSGKITVTATGNQNLDEITTSACGILCNNAALTNVTGAISTTAKSTGAVESFAIYAGKELGIKGKNSAPVTVSATSNKSKATGTAILGDKITISQWTGKTAVTSKGDSAVATIFKSGEYFAADRISSKLSATATATGENATVSGFISSGALYINDISKMDLNIKATAKKGTAVAYGIYGGGLTLGSTDLSLGKITVSATGKKDNFACGIFLDGSLGVSADLGNPVEGKIKVTASNGNAFGIIAQSVNVNSAVQIEAKGSESSCAYFIDGSTESMLRIDGAVVKATVSDKDNKDKAFAVYCNEGDAVQQVIIGEGSSVTGNIYLAGGIDEVYIAHTGNFKGAMSGVELISAEITSNNRKKAAWNITESESAEAAKLNIIFEYGISGDFLICTKESDMKWSDAIQNNIDITLGLNRYTDQFSLASGGFLEDEFFRMRLVFKGDSMILSIHEK